MSQCWKLQSVNRYRPAHATNVQDHLLINGIILFQNFLIYSLWLQAFICGYSLCRNFVGFDKILHHDLNPQKDTTKCNHHLWIEHVHVCPYTEVRITYGAQLQFKRWVRSPERIYGLNAWSIIKAIHKISVNCELNLEHWWIRTDRRAGKGKPVVRRTFGKYRIRH